MKRGKFFYPFTVEQNMIADVSKFEIYHFREDCFNNCAAVLSNLVMNRRLRTDSKSDKFFRFRFRFQILISLCSFSLFTLLALDCVRAAPGVDYVKIPFALVNENTLQLVPLIYWAVRKNVCSYDQSNLTLIGSSYIRLVHIM